MTKVDLHRRIRELERELDEAKQLNHALLTGEIDSVTTEGVVTPVLLRAAQQRMRDSEQLLRAMFDGANDANLIVDARGRFVDANPAACRIFGVSKDVLLGKRIVDFAVSEQSYSTTWSDFLSAGRLTGDFTIVRPDDEHRELEYSAVANVLPGLHLWVIRDATERKATERARGEAQQRLGTVIANAPVLLFALDREGRYTLHEGKGVELLGLRAGEVVGQPMAEREANRDDLRRALAGEQVRTAFEANGKVFDCTLVPIPDGVIGVAVDVSERKAAEDALRRSEALFRAMTEHSADGISLLSAEAKTLYQSPAVGRLLGYTLDEAGSMSWQDFVDDDQHRGIAAALGNLLEAPNNTVRMEFRIRHRDGAQRWLDLTATNLLHDPAVGAIVTNFRDVTDRRTLEREQQNFFSMSVDLLSISTFDGYFRSLNTAWEKTLGWTTAELTSMPLSELVHPDDREVTERVMRRLMSGETVAGFENRYRRKDGAYRRIEWSSIPALEENVMYAIGRDVTEQRARAELDKLLFAENPIAMWLVDGESLRFLDVNAAAVAMYGYSRDEFLSMRLTDVTVDEGEKETRRCADEVLGLGGFVRAARRHRLKGGGIRDVEKTEHRVDVGGQLRILCVVLDVTIRNQSQLELQASEARYRRIVENTSEGIWLYDAEGKTKFMNPRMAQMLGCSVEEALGKPIYAFMDEQGAEAARARLDQRMRGEGEQIDFCLKRKDGADLWVAIHADPLLDEHGRFENALALLRDITERRRDAEALHQSEEKLRQAHKMEAVGNLAGGVAHDFNNLLSIILSYTDLMLDDLKPSDALYADLQEVRKAGVRAAELTGQLLAFSRKQMLQPAVVDMNQVVGELEKMLRLIAGEDVDLTIVPSLESSTVEADRGQLEQVIVNLVVNARDAMPNGGSLTIEIDHAALDPIRASAHGSVNSDAYTVLSVSDTGTGMDSATQAHIFEPFFTTKEKGKGTGLGLSTAYGIVQQSGGHIAVESELGRGTTFRVYLPSTDGVPAPTLEKAAPKTLRGGETILLVEDEPQVRSIVRALLSRSGYRVLEAANGGDAFLASEQFEGEIGLLLTDVVMPRMNGRQLAERLLKQRPDMHVLYISGYTEDKIGQHGILDPTVDLLPKPITREALLSKVRQILDRVN